MHKACVAKPCVQCIPPITTTEWVESYLHHLLLNIFGTSYYLARDYRRAVMQAYCPVYAVSRTTTNLLLWESRYNPIWLLPYSSRLRPWIPVLDTYAFLCSCILFSKYSNAFWMQDAHVKTPVYAVIVPLWMCGEYYVHTPFPLHPVLECIASIVSMSAGFWALQQWGNLPLAGIVAYHTWSIPPLHAWHFGNVFGLWTAFVYCFVANWGGHLLKEHTPSDVVHTFILARVFYRQRDMTEYFTQQNTRRFLSLAVWYAVANLIVKERAASRLLTQLQQQYGQH